MGVRTYAWIARQPYSIRYTKEERITDDSIGAERFSGSFKDLKEPYKKNFKRGFLWPSLILVEKPFAKETKIEIYIRVFKQTYNAIVDFYVSGDMDDVTMLSREYSIPIYRVSSSRKGKRGSVQKILDFHE